MKPQRIHRARCVDLFYAMLRGYFCVSLDEAVADAQLAYSKMVGESIGELRGKNLACWCGDGPCHADVLIELANKDAAT